LLLYNFPPDFDQLFQHLAAIPQALAFLEAVKECDGLGWQISDELEATSGSNPAPIGAMLVDGNVGCGIHTYPQESLATPAL
jgi:hypothetical protein